MQDDAPVRLYAVDEEVHRSTDYVVDNRTRPAYWEKHLWVIQRTLEGAAFYEDDAGRHEVPANHAMIFTHSDSSRYGYLPESGEPYRLRYISFSAGLGLSELFARIRQDYGSVVSFPEGSAADQLFNEIFEGFKARSIPDRWHETELLYRLLLATMREQIAASIKGDPIARARNYLEEQFRSNINLKDAAGYCGITREHLCRAFRKRYHLSPAVFLRDLRLRHAHTLLISTNLPVEDISVGCGFTHANAFSRAYRKVFGHSPSETRKILPDPAHMPTEAAP